jgi:mono/diheme cytochrome c family protein
MNSPTRTSKFQQNLFVVLRGLRVFVLTLFFCQACKRDDMADQPRYKPQGPSSFFPNGASDRPPVAHTIARNAPLEPDSRAWQSPITATQFPFAITRADLLRGQLQFQIFCTPCHGILGDGDGMIPQRGFTRPATFHSDRLRNAPPSYVYNVITNGIGAMYPYNDRVPPDDRWRIAAYVRALQLSQYASIDQLSAEERAKIAEARP